VEDDDVDVQCYAILELHARNDDDIQSFAVFMYVIRLLDASTFYNGI